ncbi:MAG: DUF190 domain-containing protein [Thermoleophilaceae bacterium]
MIEDCLKLTTYLGERDRAGGGFLADALVDAYARRELRTSVVVRGVAGFGAKHHLSTDRLLTLSEDLPLVSIAVDSRERIEAALEEVVGLTGSRGLVTLERARMLTGSLGAPELPDDLPEATKLTVYLGRGERVGRRPAYVAIVELLRRHRVAGSTVLLGVDGTAHGRRERARLLGANVRVPLMVVAVGEGSRIAGLLPELENLVERPLATLERVRVCKRDGELLAEPHHLPATDPSGLDVWQKLMVYAGEQVRHEGRPLYRELVHRLRREGALGATALRGVWGYHGDHEPHGDSFRQLRRRVPVLAVVVDRPDRIRRWFELIDELTPHTGLVTSEMVPAFAPTGPRLATLDAR